MKEINKYDFDKKVTEVYNKTKVQVQLGELEQVLKAAKKCIRFTIMSDNFLGSGLACEDEEMAKAYKTINEQLINIRERAAKNARNVVNKKFKSIKG